MTSPPSQGLVLVADDEDDIRRALGLLLKRAGFRMVEAADPAEALAQLERQDVVAALVDMNYQLDTTSGAEGLELIARISERDAALPVIAMTAWASVELAVHAMRAGAVDFIEKPWNNTRVLRVLQGRVALRQSQRDNHALGQAQRLLMADGTGEMVVRSAAMQAFMRDWFQVARSNANVLLLGENGTGKSMLAGLLHQQSPRRDGPFVKVDIGGLAPALFESELFGHVRGAFTDARSDRQGRIELADKGTLFLDEIGNLPLEQQAKILRVIEEGAFERVGSSTTKRVDVRFVSATNANLASEVTAGRFRQDLLYRLNPLQLRVPALRERREDIEELARHFLQAAARRYQRSNLELSAQATLTLLDYAWPGNVRELSHVMERVALLAPGQVVDVDDLRLEDRPVETTEPTSTAAADLLALTLDQAEALLLGEALKKHRGNVQRAAEQLGVSRQSLYRRMERHGLGANEPD